MGSLLRAVLWDLGETLVHLDEPWSDVLQENVRALHTYLSTLGLQFDFDQFATRFLKIFDEASANADTFKIEIPMQEILTKVMKKSGLQFLGLDLPTTAMMEFYRPEVERWQLFPDTLDTLTKLRDEGFVLGVVSNAKSDWLVRSIIQRRELNTYFPVIVSSAAVKIRKPRSEIFTEALKSLNVKAVESAFIGDSISADVSGANRMGMHSIHVLRKPITATHPARPDATVAQLAEIPKILEQWNNNSPP